MTTPPHLSEKNFIHEGYKQDPFPFWFWFIVFSSFVIILWSGYSWYARQLSSEYQHDPFLQVTNREMSVFLWQEPSLMRINTPAKTAYMPGFQYLEKISLDLSFADDYVIAPPEVIFKYHAWHRLVSDEFTQRPIEANEFKEFLGYAEEWLPQYWPDAPSDYAGIIKNLNHEGDIAPLLPVQVRQAFQGWKNYFKEGEEINSLMIDFQQLNAFLVKFPHYSRNFWRNIAGGSYLLSTLNPPANPEDIVPREEIPPFLRVALYNYAVSEK